MKPSQTLSLKEAQERQQQQEDDIQSLQRIRRVVLEEGFTKGPILEAVNSQIKYVQNGGTL